MNSTNKYNIKYLTADEIMENMVARSQQKQPIKQSNVTYESVHKLLERCATLNYSAVDVLRLFEWEFK